VKILTRDVVIPAGTEFYEIIPTGDAIKGLYSHQVNLTDTDDILRDVVPGERRVVGFPPPGGNVDGNGLYWRARQSFVYASYVGEWHAKRGVSVILDCGVKVNVLQDAMISCVEDILVNTRVERVRIEVLPGDSTLASVEWLAEHFYKRRVTPDFDEPYYPAVDEGEVAMRHPPKIKEPLNT
jgi:hypothetical protein